MRAEPGDGDRQRCGAGSTVTPKATTSSGFDCFYVHGTISLESPVKAGPRRGKVEIASATAQAAPFAPDREVYAPAYWQVTLAGLAAHVPGERGRTTPIVSPKKGRVS